MAEAASQNELQVPRVRRPAAKPRSKPKNDLQQPVIYNPAAQQRLQAKVAKMLAPLSVRVDDLFDFVSSEVLSEPLSLHV